MQKYQDSNIFVIYSIVFFCYYISWLLTVEFSKIQNLINLNFSANIASLIFLPHGIRVLSICLLGIKAIPILILASIATGAYYLSINEALILTFASICGLLIAFPLLQIPREGLTLNKINYQFILKVAIATSITSSILNVIAKFFLDQAIFNNDNLLFVLPAHIVGDILGSILCFYIIGKLYSLFKKIS